MIRRNVKNLNADALQEEIEKALEKGDYAFLAEAVDLVALKMSQGFFDKKPELEEFLGKETLTEFLTSINVVANRLVSRSAYFPRAMTVFKAFAMFGPNDEVKEKAAASLFRHVDKLKVEEGKYHILFFTANALTQTYLEKDAARVLIAEAKTLYNLQVRQAFFRQAKEALIPRSEIHKIIAQELEAQENSTKLGFFQHVGRKLTKNRTCRSLCRAAEKANKSGDEEFLVHVVEDMMNYMKEERFDHLKEDKVARFFGRTIVASDKLAENNFYARQAVEALMVVAEKAAKKGGGDREYRKLCKSREFYKNRPQKGRFSAAKRAKKQKADAFCRCSYSGYSDEVAKAIARHAHKLLQEKSERALFCGAKALFNKGVLAREITETFIKTVKLRKNKNERLSIFLKARRGSDSESFLNRSLDIEICEMKTAPYGANVLLPHAVGFLPMPRRNSCCALK